MTFSIIVKTELSSLTCDSWTVIIDATASIWLVNSVKMMIDCLRWASFAVIIAAASSTIAQIKAVWYCLELRWPLSSCVYGTDSVAASACGLMPSTIAA